MNSQEIVRKFTFNKLNEIDINSYCDIAPTDAALPIVTFSVLNCQRIYFCGAVGFDEVVAIIKVWDKNKYNNDLFNLVKNTIDRQVNATVDDYNIMSVLSESERSSNDYVDGINYKSLEVILNFQVEVKYGDS